MEKVTKMMLVAIAVFGLISVATAQQLEWGTDVTGTALGAPAIADAAGVGKTANGIAVASATNGGWVFACGTVDMTATAGNAAAVTMAGWVASFNPSSGALVSKMVFNDAVFATSANLGAGNTNAAGADVVALNAIAVDNTRDIVYTVGLTDNASVDASGAASSADLIVAFGFTPTTGVLNLTIGGSTNTRPLHAVWSNNGDATDGDNATNSGMNATAGIVNAAAGGNLPTADADGDSAGAMELLGVAVNQTTGTIYCVGGESNTAAADHTYGVCPGGASAGCNFNGTIVALTYTAGNVNANGRGSFSIPAGVGELTRGTGLNGAVGAGSGFDTVLFGVAVASDGSVYVCGTQGSATGFSATVTKLPSNLGNGGVTWQYSHAATENGGVVNLNSSFFSMTLSGSTVIAAGTRQAGASATLDNDADSTRNGLVVSINTSTGLLNWYAEYDDNDAGNGKANNAGNAAVVSLGLGATAQSIEFRGVATDGSFVYITGTAMAANADAGPHYTAGLTRFMPGAATGGNATAAPFAPSRDPRLFDDAVAGAINMGGVTQLIGAKIDITNGNLIWDGEYNEASVGTGSGQAIALDSMTQTLDVAGFRETTSTSAINDATIGNVSRGATSNGGSSNAVAGGSSGGSGGCGAVGVDALALLGIAYLIRRKANKS